VLKITNPRNGLSKFINTNKYTAQEVDTIIVFYTKIGFKVTWK